jgi:uncharacterized spore protein YtfJ
MTTDFKADDKAGMDDDFAFEQAQKAATTSIDGFVERMAERVGSKASVRAVFGDPIERDGITVIPVARVRWGFGGGAGRGPIAVGPGAGDGAGTTTFDEGISGAGTGGGGGVTADPLGYIEIGPDGATFKPIASPMPSPGFLLAAGVSAGFLLRGIARLFRR